MRAMSESVANVTEHLNIWGQGSPAQQILASDIKAMLQDGLATTPSNELVEVKAELAEAKGKLLAQQSNLDSLLDVRDALQAQLDKALADLKAADDKNTELEAELADTQAKSPLSAAAAPVGGRVASEDLAKT